MLSFPVKLLYGVQLDVYEPKLSSRARWYLDMVV